MRLLIATTVLVLGATSAFAQTAPAPAATPPASAPLQLEVAVRGYGADNHARSNAGDSAVDKLEGYVWADRSLCALGAGTSAPSNTPWVGWHFIGTVQGIVSEGGRNAVVFRVEWQRIWELGAKVNEGSKGVSSASLREGERTELDRAVAAEGAAGACGTTNARLEIGVVARPAYRMAADRLQEIARAGARGASAGTIAPKSQPVETYAETLKQYKLQAFLKQPGTYEAELWLVHRRPDGTETTEQTQKIRFAGTDVAFNFPAVIVNTSNGDLTLDFSGTLRAGVGPDAKSFPGFYLRKNFTDAYMTTGTDSHGRPFTFFNLPDGYGIRSAVASGTAASDDTERIAVTFARRIHGGTPAIDTRGGSYFFMTVPAPTDVVSFEFPTLPNVSQDLLKGHTFSLRIRVAPVAK